MFGYSPHDDEAWDEERWEAFLRANDRRVDRFMELFFRFTRRYPRPDPADADAHEAWKQALRAFLQDQGWREDLAPPFFWLGHTPDADDVDDLFSSSGYLLDEDAGTFDDLVHLPVYQHALDLSNAVLDWAHALSGKVKNSTLVHFCSHLSQVAANVARGHGIGREREVLSGNIAFAKRALADANAALDLLRQMRRAPYMDETTYRRLYEQVYEVRNELALYILDLRDLFDLGVD